MRNFDEIMRDAEALPGNAVLVTPQEAEACATRLVEELRIVGINRDIARMKLLTGQMSLCGKQVTVGR